MEEETGIRVVDPAGCHLRALDGLSDAGILDALEVVRVLEDESHLVHSLKRCRTCGQLYFYEFYEEIDWVGGNDPQYRTLIPVADEASAERLNAKAPIELLRYLAIRMDYPREAGAPQPPRWFEGWRTT